MAAHEESPPQEQMSRSVAHELEFEESPVAAYRYVRDGTRALSAPLELEDFCLQSMEDASPAKWHLAHTSWFFEEFVLATEPTYAVFHPGFAYLFNSYYESVGSMHPRPQRGLITRPNVAEVFRYREAVDAAMIKKLESGSFDDATLKLVELGLHHEQQHQELILTDVKHGFSCNPLQPQYREGHERPECDRPAQQSWLEHPGGVARIGQENGFSFDNEGPTHRVFVEPFALGSRLVTCAEYLEFMADGGYERPELWLSAGWAKLQTEHWTAPGYWSRESGRWRQFTLDGVRDLELCEPVCHVSYFEADAYARWTGFRLPTEFDWEIIARNQPVRGNFVETGALHPTVPDDESDEIAQMFGDAWEWTHSAYAPYPGYRASPGALGEYNGKFMCSQIVLRGGSCATPASHARATYRNFFYPDARWQFTGIRLARDL